MAARAAIVLNPRSGRAPDRLKLERVLRDAGFHANISCLPEGPGAAAYIASTAREHDIIVAAGGDGTVSAVADAAIRQTRVFGVIPAGTLNHFARDAGIPLPLNEAVSALAAGHTRLLDVGEINGIVFVNNVSIGAYPRLLWERRRARQRGLPRHAAVSLAAVRTWLALRTITVRLCVEGEEIIRRTPFVFVGNGRYELEGIQFGRRPSMTDGKLSLYVAPNSGRFDSLMLPTRVLMRKLRGYDKFEMYLAASISLEPSRRHVAVALDGEVRRLESPLRFQIRRHALQTILPPNGDR